MIIRQEQMAVLAGVHQRKFEDELAEHLNRCFPDKCAALGEARMRHVIRHGIGRAASHGINLERDICKFIDLMFVFGYGFDECPDLPWVTPILEDDSFKNSTAKMEYLFDEGKRQRMASIRSTLQ